MEKINKDYYIVRSSIPEEKQKDPVEHLKHEAAMAEPLQNVDNYNKENGTGCNIEQEQEEKSSLDASRWKDVVATEAKESSNQVHVESKA